MRFASVGVLNMADNQGNLANRTQASPRQQMEVPDKGMKEHQHKAEIPLDYSAIRHGVDVNMEAPISKEDLMHAGGLGARDDLNSMLPSAVDGTDYEETLMETMEYEDPTGKESHKIAHPGLGATREQVHIPGGTMFPSQIPQLGER